MYRWIRIAAMSACVALLCATGATAPQHSADTTPDNAISLSELLRVIQFYNVGGVQCSEGTEDGFAPGAGPQDCAPHASDYAPQNWVVSLSELLRLIQFYNSPGYHCCAETNSEDGYCPGPGGGVCPGEGEGEQPDTTAPVLLLAGPLTVAVECGQDYVEPGAMASDAVDGDLTGSIEIDATALDPLDAGLKTVTYTVSDAAGNVATRTRVVFSLCDAPVALGDAALEAAVRTALDKPAGDLLPSDLADPAFTTLAAPGAGIADLTGLAYAVSLTTLDLHGNCIADLSPLAHLDGLVSLNLHDNDVSDIAALRHLAALRLLWLGRNQITDIQPLVANTGLDGDDLAQQWDRINLNFNPLPESAVMDLDALEARGAAVWRPALIAGAKGNTQEARSARLTLLSDDGDVRLSRVAELTGATPAPKPPADTEPRVTVWDGTRSPVTAPVRFPLEVTSCGLDAPGGESVGDFEALSVAEIAVTVPVAGPVARVEYRASATAPAQVLYNGPVKGVDPCGAVEEPGDPVPIGARLIHGDPDLPDSRAYVLLVMGDAFPEEGLGDPRAPLVASNTHYIPFSQAVGDSFAFLLEQEPFAQFAPLLKVYRVDLVSVDNRPTDLRTEPPTERDTALRMGRKSTGFDYDQALCARVASNTGIGWDKVVLIPNGDGSGTQTADFIVYSNFSPSRKRTALHEFGHGVGVLSDEYEYRHGTNPPASYDPADVDAPNAIARGLSVPVFDDIPWRHWLVDTDSEGCMPSALGDVVDFGCLSDSETDCQCTHAPQLETDCVPLPTCEPDGDFVDVDGKLYGRIAWPEPGAFPSVVGLFEGAKYRRKGAYRPELRCRMRSDDDVEPGLQETLLFCRVCRENLVAQILSRAGNMARATPDPAEEIQVPLGGAALDFVVVLHAPVGGEHAPVVQGWGVDGADVPGATGLSLQRTPAQLGVGAHTVSVTVANPTPWIHPEFAAGQAMAEQTVTWNIVVE